MSTPADDKKAAMSVVDEHADKAWKSKVDDCIFWLAKRNAEFSADSVWWAMEEHYPRLRTHEPRAMGPRMMRAAKRGLIEKTGRSDNSNRPRGHQRPVAVWRSLIYDCACVCHEEHGGYAHPDETCVCKGGTGYADR